MAPSGSHWDHRVGDRHLRFLNVSLQHHHFGPHEDPDRWKHRTLRRRVRLGWLRRLEGMQVDNIKPLRLWSRCDGHSGKSSMRNWRNCTFRYSVQSFYLLVVTWISPGVPSAGFTRHKKSELRAHQMARKFEVPGSPRTKIRAELSSNGSDVRPAGLTPHKKIHAEVLWNGDRWSERRPRIS